MSVCLTGPTWARVSAARMHHPRPEQGKRDHDPATGIPAAGNPTAPGKHPLWRGCGYSLLPLSRLYPNTDKSTNQNLPKCKRATREMSLWGLFLKLKQLEILMFKRSHSSGEASRGPRSVCTAQGLAESVRSKAAHAAVYSRQKSIPSVAFFSSHLGNRMRVPHFSQRRTKTFNSRKLPRHIYPSHNLIKSPEAESRRSQAAPNSQAHGTRCHALPAHARSFQPRAPPIAQPGDVGKLNA